MTKDQKKKYPHAVRVEVGIKGFVETLKFINSKNIEFIWEYEPKVKRGMRINFKTVDDKFLFLLMWDRDACEKA